MGHFGRLWKRARNSNGWSAAAYTGSAAAGADFVSESVWCVVYGADVVYQSEGEKLESITVSTNFVNPNSTGNPSSLACYLYTFDPTSDGSDSVSAPPAGYWSAAFASADVGIIGSFCSFGFTKLGIRPQKLWFWFTSAVSYESLGSNSIYHYATGNYDSALSIGTRTPSLEGVFTGGSGSGDSGGGGAALYTVVDSGSQSGIYAERSFSYSRKAFTASCTALTFQSAGQVLISCRAKSGAVYMRGYLCTQSGFDTQSGTPTGNISANGEGAEYSFTAQVKSGVSYILWTVLDSGGETELELSIVPQSWDYSLIDRGSALNLAQNQRSFSMSMGKFQTGRMKLSFAFSGQTEIKVTAAESAFSAMIFISDQADIDSATGRPLSYFDACSANSSTYLNVKKGQEFYFFAVYNGGSEAGAVGFTILPPPVLWSAGGGANQSLLSSEMAVNISLAEFRYSTIKLSFAHSGTAVFNFSQTLANSSAIDIYQCDEDVFDTYYGVPAMQLDSRSFHGDMELGFAVVAGQDYYFYIRSGDEESAVSARLKISPPTLPTGYRLEQWRYHHIEHDSSSEIYLGYYSYSVSMLTFKYRGKAAFSAEKFAGDEKLRPHLRAYLCKTQGIDESKGVPTGEIICAYTGEGESFAMSADVQEEEDYYLYIVCSEIYGDTGISLKLSIGSPEARYYSITEKCERYGIESLDYSAAPGESGVLLMELSFNSSGFALIETSLSGGDADFVNIYASHLPYLDGSSGTPAAQLIKSSTGSSDEPEPALQLPVRRNDTYYIFVRGEGVYRSARFDVSVSVRKTAAGIFTQDGYICALPCVYHEGSWRAALPLCRGRDGWLAAGQDKAI